MSLVSAAPALLAQGGFVQDRSADASGEAGCVARDGVCPSWIVDNFDRYTGPLERHVLLTVVALAIGFAISFSLALLAHRRRWLVTPIVQVTGILYTIPSLALFFLLLPITGRGFLTAEVALVSYTLLIIFRNVTTGTNDPHTRRTSGSFKPRFHRWKPSTISPFSRIVIACAHPSSSNEVLSNASSGENTRFGL